MRFEIVDGSLLGLRELMSWVESEKKYECFFVSCFVVCGLEQEFLNCPFLPKRCFDFQWTTLISMFDGLIRLPCYGREIMFDHA